MFDIQAVRAQFPALHQPTANGTPPIFFDNPAGTQVPQRVIDAVVNYYTTMNANSGGRFATSQRSDAMMQQAREHMAAFLNAPDSREIVFGQNMTTHNFAISRALGREWQAGDELVLTRMDHDANVAPWLHMASDKGMTVKWVDIKPTDCTLDLDSLEAALSTKTKVVACGHASNAVGTINPVRQIAEMAHAAGALFVMDAVQSAPHIPIDVQDIGCDILMCSAYKFFGPHIGILWGRYDLLDRLQAYKVRPAKNTPPDKFETGTLSFETIAGVSAAVDYIASLGEDNTPHGGMRAIHTYETTLLNQLIAGLQAIPGITIAGIVDPARYIDRVPTVVFVKEGRTPAEIATALADQHIYVWNGNYYAVEIMNALGRTEHGMVRVGLAHYNTAEEVDKFLDAVRAL
jgi:cysteine desulfurase family protein (TIGR01976 family)